MSYANVSRFSNKYKNYTIKSCIWAVFLFHILTTYSKLFIDFMFLRKDYCSKIALVLDRVFFTAWSDIRDITICLSGLSRVS